MMVGKIDITVGFSDHHALVCMGSGAIKVIAGIRRCGKTRLAFTFFRELLRKSSVPDDPVIEDTLDDFRDIKALLWTTTASSRWDCSTFGRIRAALIVKQSLLAAPAFFSFAIGPRHSQMLSTEGQSQGK